MPAPPLLGKTDRELACPGAGRAACGRIAPRLVSGWADPVEFTLPLVNGKKYRESRSFPIGGRRGLSTYMALIDITERKRAEEALEQQTSNYVRSRPASDLPARRKGRALRVSCTMSSARP